MTDTEVGELWQAFHTHPSKGGLTREEAIDLIRKLVQCWSIFYLYKVSDIGIKRAVKFALSDFDIDPATWKEED
jgi:hypothetical protein